MPAFSLENLTFGYTPSALTLSNLSFDIHDGEFLSIAGPNGAGKSTLLRLLDRILLPSRGSITLRDRPLTSFRRVELARLIGFVPQDGGLHFPFTVREIVLMGRAPHSRGAVFENAHDREVADRTIALMDIVHLADQPVTTLSGGERQRVLIARALAQEPGILLLDEPNAHLDIGHQIEVFRILKQLNRESGLTIISVSHDLNLAASFSDRMVLLSCGTLAAIGTPSEVLSEERIRNVFRTNVLVDPHPQTQSVRITLLTT